MRTVVFKGLQGLHLIILFLWRFLIFVGGAYIALIAFFVVVLVLFVKKVFRLLVAAPTE
jgi:hypothetical protein